MMISIHALLAESDACHAARCCQRKPFLSTLSLRRATSSAPPLLTKPSFLSTLSLRRATCKVAGNAFGRGFLSTLSLRRATGVPRRVSDFHTISIHALLAESDQVRFPQCLISPISIHALLAESDGHPAPCRSAPSISIHALLAESDVHPEH